MSDTKFGTFDELIDGLDHSIQSICVELRDLVISVDPESVEVVRLGDRAATYGLGPKKMSEGYCYILPYDNWVNLGFYRGTDLSDPAKLLEGTGARMRHVKVRGMEAPDRDLLRALIEASVSERRAALG